MPSIQKFIEAMRWAADSDKVGYDQNQRTTVEFYSNRDTESDCSWLTIAALRYAGFDTGNATYTGNMSEELCARGWKRIANDGNPQVGDILLNDKDHVAVYIGDGMLAQASIDEHGNIAGGQAGDQTGDEVNVRSYYNYPWNCYLRWTGVSDASGSTSPAAAKSAVKVPKAGNSVKFRVSTDPKCKKWLADGRFGVRGAGICFIVIDDVKRYRVFTMENGWLPYGCVGDGSPIMGVEIDDDSIMYAARPMTMVDYYPWMVGRTSTDAGDSDHFAGDLANQIDGFKAFHAKA